jgi:hypothetical protein
MKVKVKVVPHLRSGKCPGGATEKRAGKRGKLCWLSMGKVGMGSKKGPGKAGLGKRK